MAAMASSTNELARRPSPIAVAEAEQPDRTPLSSPASTLSYGSHGSTPSRRRVKRSAGGGASKSPARGRGMKTVLATMSMEEYRSREGLPCQAVHEDEQGEKEEEASAVVGEPCERRCQRDTGMVVAAHLSHMLTLNGAHESSSDDEGEDEYSSDYDSADDDDDGSDGSDQRASKRSMRGGSSKRISKRRLKGKSSRKLGRQRKSSRRNQEADDPGNDDDTHSSSSSSSSSEAYSSDSTEEEENDGEDGPTVKSKLANIAARAIHFVVHGVRRVRAATKTNTVCAVCRCRCYVRQGRLPMPNRPCASCGHAKAEHVVSASATLPALGSIVCERLCEAMHTLELRGAAHMPYLYTPYLSPSGPFAGLQACRPPCSPMRFTAYMQHLPASSSAAADVALHLQTGAFAAKQHQGMALSQFDVRDVAAGILLTLSNNAPVLGYRPSGMLLAARTDEAKTLDDKWSAVLDTSKSASGEYTMQLKLLLRVLMHCHNLCEAGKPGNDRNSLTAVFAPLLLRASEDSILFPPNFPCPVDVVQQAAFHWQAMQHMLEHFGSIIPHYVEVQLRTTGWLADAGDLPRGLLPRTDAEAIAVGTTLAAATGAGEGAGAGAGTGAGAGLDAGADSATAQDMEDSVPDAHLAQHEIGTSEYEIDDNLAAGFETQRGDATAMQPRPALEIPSSDEEEAAAAAPEIIEGTESEVEDIAGSEHPPGMSYRDLVEASPGRDSDGTPEQPAVHSPVTSPSPTRRGPPKPPAQRQVDSESEPDDEAAVAEEEEEEEAAAVPSTARSAASVAEEDVPAAHNADDDESDAYTTEYSESDFESEIGSDMDSIASSEMSTASGQRRRRRRGGARGVAKLLKPRSGLHIFSSVLEEKREGRVGRLRRKKQRKRLPASGSPASNRLSPSPSPIRKIMKEAKDAAARQQRRMSAEAAAVMASARQDRAVSPVVSPHKLLAEAAARKAGQGAGRQRRKRSQSKPGDKQNQYRRRSNNNSSNDRRPSRRRSSAKTGASADVVEKQLQPRAVIKPPVPRFPHARRKKRRKGKKGAAEDEEEEQAPPGTPLPWHQALRGRSMFKEKPEPGSGKPRKRKTSPSPSVDSAPSQASAVVHDASPHSVAAAGKYKVQQKQKQLQQPQRQRRGKHRKPAVRAKLIPGQSAAAAFRGGFEKLSLSLSRLPKKGQRRARRQLERALAAAEAAQDAAYAMPDDYDADAYLDEYADAGHYGELGDGEAEYADVDVDVDAEVKQMLAAAAASAGMPSDYNMFREASEHGESDHSYYTDAAAVEDEGEDEAAEAALQYRDGAPPVRWDRAAPMVAAAAVDEPVLPQLPAPGAAPARRKSSVYMPPPAPMTLLPGPEAAVPASIQALLHPQDIDIRMALPQHQQQQQPVHRHNGAGRGAGGSPLLGHGQPSAAAAAAIERAKRYASGPQPGGRGAGPAAAAAPALLARADKYLSKQQPKKAAARARVAPGHKLQAMPAGDDDGGVVKTQPKPKKKVKKLKKKKPKKPTKAKAKAKQEEQIEF